MPAGGLASSGIGLLLGVGQAIWGNSEKKKYQRQIDALNANRPKYSINPEENYIQNLAESRANQGMGAGARQQLTNNTDRTLGSLTSAALMGGADANTLGNIADKVQNSYNQNAIYDDQVRLQNLSNLQNVWARQSANRDKMWQINDYQPWKDKMTGASQQLQGANNLFMGGLNMAGGSLMSLGRGLFGGGGGGGGGSMGGGSNSGGGGADYGGAGMAAAAGGMGGGAGDYGGSNLGTGGYSTPFMVNTGMGGTSGSYTSNGDPSVQFLGNNSNSIFG